jgi:hypothetical protein
MLQYFNDLAQVEREVNALQLSGVVITMNQTSLQLAAMKRRHH